MCPPLSHDVRSRALLPPLLLLHQLLLLSMELDGDVRANPCDDDDDVVSRRRRPRQRVPDCLRICCKNRSDYTCESLRDSHIDKERERERSKAREYTWEMERRMEKKIFFPSSVFMSALVANHSLPGTGTGEAWREIDPFHVCLCLATFVRKSDRLSHDESTESLV